MTKFLLFLWSVKSKVERTQLDSLFIAFLFVLCFLTKKRSWKSFSCYILFYPKAPCCHGGIEWWAGNQIPSVPFLPTCQDGKQWSKLCFHSRVMNVCLRTWHRTTEFFLSAYSSLWSNELNPETWVFLRHITWVFIYWFYIKPAVWVFYFHVNTFRLELLYLMLQGWI